MSIAVPITDKAARQQLLRELLASRELGSQREALAALADHDVACNQATVSRDLDELGAVKVRGVDGRLAYRLRADLATHGRDRAEATLRQFVTDVTHSGNLAVLRTPPACAQPVASAIDLGGFDDVIATVAGDDTVLVVAAEGVPGATLATRFRRLIGR
jgi:transcriptional regulator of arginine metabolism